MIKSLSTRVLVVGAALGLAGVLVLPAQPEGGQLASIAAAPDRFLAGSALNFLAATLIGAGLLILGQRAAGQGRRVAAAFAGVAGVGWLLHTVVIAINAASYELALESDRTVATRLLESLYEGPVFLGALVPMLVLTLVGMVGAPMALWRAGHAPLWSTVAVVLAIFSDFVGPEELSGVPMFALLVIGFAGLRDRAKKPVAPAVKVPVSML